MFITKFGEVCIGAEFMLGSEDFIKEDETKAKNITNDGLFRFFKWDTKVYVARKRDIKVGGWL